MKTLLAIIIGLTVVIGLHVSGLVTFHWNADATGGAGEISKLIMPMIDRAIEYLEQGNTDAALEEINTLKQELKDTFEVDDK
jgi:Tfp pilus assembly protein PilF